MCQWLCIERTYSLRCTDPKPTNKNAWKVIFSVLLLYYAGPSKQLLNFWKRCLFLLTWRWQTVLNTGDKQWQLDTKVTVLALRTAAVPLQAAVGTDWKSRATRVRHLTCSPWKQSTGPNALRSQGCKGNAFSPLPTSEAERRSKSRAVLKRLKYFIYQTHFCC